MMYANPEKFEFITVWESGFRKWSVLGVENNGQEQIIKGGFSSKILAQYWMDEYLNRYVKEHMFPHDLDEFEFEYLDGE
ncbi:hypothetical protein SEA_WOFFORD_208 [Streptomyces phage Wofford]|uniref:Uncharacterized protein n=1 Tax=Streptomyces phage Wofford TaxID=2283267 RepID=A0A345MA29_9CAUD|nr:hypothetical protein HWB78_gp105 [Streptomyces phage Wollford]AXH67350.1 hypothetical protein SEA_WOFFORD_208 [Streptomyces phage Wollford]